MSKLREAENYNDNQDVVDPIIGHNFQKSVLGDSILNQIDGSMNFAADIDDFAELNITEQRSKTGSQANSIDLRQSIR